MLWLRSAFFTLALPGTVLVWVPLGLSTLDGSRLDIGWTRWIGAPLVVLGAWGLLWCIWDFGRQGHGTLAPIDAPRFVVHSGLYRIVRNPMYVAVVMALVGEGLLFRSIRLLAWTAFVAVAVHSFVLVYEEPTLRGRFGSDYDAYRRAVPRWLPRPPVMRGRRSR